MIAFDKALKCYTNNENINDYVFIKYLNTIDYRDLTKHNKRVYDSLGIIDTLGYSMDKSCNSFSYSDEFASIYAIKSGKYWFVYVNYDSSDKRSYIFNFNPFA
jgi:hypothetical protein